MNIFQAAVLGLVQGLTEFIPISSTAHLRIVPALLGWADPGTAFSAVIQLGTLLAVLVYFAGDLWALLRAGLRSLWRTEARRDPTARMAWAILLGNLPIVVLGLTFRELIETRARGLALIAAMLILVALALWLAERVARQKRMAAQLGWQRIFGIGLFQALALIPGASRSGSTILGGLLFGLRREEAARFSFLLGVPAILGSGLLQLPPVLSGAQATGVVPLLVGLAVSAVSGYAAIGFLLRYLRTRTTLAFVVYRLGLGALVLWLALSGMVE